MPITRRDIIAKVFSTMGGGYDADEVDAFLDLVADTLELRDDALHTERQRAAILTAEIRRLEAQIADLKKATARADNADAEARELLEQAKLQARMVISAAREEAKRIVQEAAEQAELIVKKSLEQTAARPPLSERIAGFALRPVALEPVQTAVPKGDSAPEGAQEGAKEPVYPKCEEPDAASSPAAESSFSSDVEAQSFDGGAPADPEVLECAAPEAIAGPPAGEVAVTGDAPLKGDEEEALQGQPGDENQPEEPAGAQIGEEAQATAAVSTSEEQSEDSSEDPSEDQLEKQPKDQPVEQTEEQGDQTLRLEEAAEPAMPAEFPKAERPAAFRPRLEIVKPPRPEDVYDEADGFYPATDWLKDPDSRYEK
ncbi:MAG: DivIVA domain-containing protein [Christensenellales bacterium]|jgi:DivIVA domain-containing protein